MKINLFTKPLTSISIHYSTDCNMDCAYCYIDKKNKTHTIKNIAIRKALADGTFFSNIQKIYNTDNVRAAITGYDLWGAEPTINGDLFQFLHPKMMEYFPNINYFNFSTNGWCGGEAIYKNFIIPLLQYAEQHKREMNFEIQFSLDGPPEINDYTRRKGATEHTINTIKTLFELIPESEYLIVTPTLKSTWNMDIFKNYTDLNKLQNYFNWCDDFMTQFQLWGQNKINVEVHRSILSPTIATPTLATVEDAQNFSRWLTLLTEIDTSHYNYFNHKSLFHNGFVNMQLLSTIPKFDTENILDITTCSAGQHWFAIHYDGTLSYCHQIAGYSISEIAEEKYLYNLLTTKEISSLSTRQLLNQIYSYNDSVSRFKLFKASVAALAAAGQINKKYTQSNDDCFMLWCLCNTQQCPAGQAVITTNLSIPTFGTIKWWGNGAIDSLIKYYYHEIKRGIN